MSDSLIWFFSPSPSPLVVGLYWLCLRCSTSVPQNWDGPVELTVGPRRRRGCSGSISTKRLTGWRVQLRNLRDGFRQMYLRQMQCRRCDSRARVARGTMGAAGSGDTDWRRCWRWQSRVEFPGSSGGCSCAAMAAWARLTQRASGRLDFGGKADFACDRVRRTKTRKRKRMKRVGREARSRKGIYPPLCGTPSDIRP